MTDRARAVVTALVPELERVRPKSLALRPAPTSEEHANESPLERKLRFERALTAAGLGGLGQGSETAEKLGIKRTTLIGRRNLKALDRLPTDQDFETLADIAEFNRLAAKLSRSA